MARSLVSPPPPSFLLYLSLSLSSKKQCPFAANDEPNLQPNIENPSTREGTGVESAEKPNMVVKQYKAQ